MTQPLNRSHKPRQLSLAHQQGLSLLELMVSLAIGLVLLLGLASIYTVAIRATDQNEFVVATDEKSRQIFRLFSQEFEQAGFVDPTDAAAQPAGCPDIEVNKPYGAYTASFTDSATNATNLYLRFKDASVADTSKLSPIGLVTCGNKQAITAADDNQITISYQIAKSGSTQSFSDLPSLANTRDCTGTALTAATNGFVSNTYELDGTNLTCKSNVNTTPRTLVHDVQEMQFRYLVTTAETDKDTQLLDTDSGRVVKDTLTATDISKETLGWASVVGVEICLITGIELSDGRAPTALARQQSKVGANYQRPQCFTNDKTNAEDQNKLYTRYNKTFSLPNALYLPPRKP